MLFWRLNQMLRQTIACLFLVMFFAAAQTSRAKGPVNELTLREFLELVLEHNESIQERLLEFEINRKHHNAEWGAFEPEFVASYDRVENDRTNTAQQQIVSANLLTFSEKNNI